MTPRIAILGANGFIGSHLVRILRLRDAECFTFSSREPGNINPATGLLCEDFELPKNLDSVVYLSQSPFYRPDNLNTEHLFNVNHISARACLRKASDAGAKSFIYTSTGSVYSPSFEPLKESSPISDHSQYAASKLAGENEVLNFRSTMRTQVIRPFGVYGPGQKSTLISKILGRVRENQSIVLEPKPEPESLVDVSGLKISLCYVEDVARIIIALAEKQGPSILNIAGPEPISLRQIATSIARHLNSKPMFQTAAVPRKGDLWADVTLLKEFYGNSITTFEEGLSRSLNVRPLDLPIV